MNTAQSILKFVNVDILFQEIPNEVSLGVSISGCPNKCKGCHSSYLMGDVGEPLDIHKLKQILDNYKDSITNVLFMGGDHIPNQLILLFIFITSQYPKLKISLYSGKQEINKRFAPYLSYYKVGPWIEKCGPLSNPNTNQKLYKIVPSENGKTRNFENITHLFWK